MDSPVSILMTIFIFVDTPVTCTIPHFAYFLGLDAPKCGHYAKGNTYFEGFSLVDCQDAFRKCTNLQSHWHRVR